MSNLFELIKVDLRETLDARKFKENKGKSIPFLAFISLIGLLFLFLSTIYNFMFTEMFYLMGESVVYSTIMMGFIASMLAVSTSIFKVKSIFVGKDYEMLISMPIKKSTIIASKIINLYIIELLYTAILMIPNLIITTIYSQDLTFIITGILSILLIPALPMAIACIFSVFITLVADRFKFGNIINFILYFVLFIAIFYFSFSMNMSTTSENPEDMTGMLDMVKNIAWINPTLQLIRLAHLNNYLFILLFAGANVLLLIMAILFISLLLDKIHAVINSFKTNNVYIRKKLETKGQLKALLSNEYKRFFKSKYYFINSISSGICALVFSGLIAYFLNDLGPELNEFMPYIKEYAYLGAVIIAFAIGISTPASASISIEGQNFWMIKCYPIDYKKLVLAKLIMSCSILGACSVISSAIIIIFIQPTIFSAIMLVIIPLLYVILTSIIGLVINLSYYKLKWKNEQECVKNSAGVVISMFVDWGVTFVMAGALIGLAFVNVYLSALAGLGVLLIAIIFFYSILMNTVNNKINKIEEF